MIVVKLGGSLYASDYLQDWVDVLASNIKQTIIIVPGGGPFADQVRQASKDWDINDKTAHEMAVLGMQQYALLIASLNDDIQVLESASVFVNKPLRGTFVWLPHKNITENCDLPNNWDVTSDSISLWLADQLSADKLCLIKSAQISDLTYEQLISSDITDKYFSQLSRDFGGELLFYNASDAEKFHNDIKNG